MNTRIITFLTATVTLLTLAIGAGAFVISYDALYATGLTYGIPGPKAWIWPLLIDTPLVVFTLALLVSQIMRQSAKLWAGLVILYTLATVAFNLSHAQPTPLGWLVAIVAPVGLLLTTEALRHLARSIIERQAIVESLAELAAQVDKGRADLDKLTGQIEAAQARLEAVKAETIAEKQNKNTAFVPGDLSKLETANAARMDKIGQRRVSVLDKLQAGLSPEAIADDHPTRVSGFNHRASMMTGPAYWQCWNW